MLAAAVAGALAALVAVLVKLLAVDGEAVAPAAEVEAEGWEVALLAAATAFVSPLPNCAIEPVWVLVADTEPELPDDATVGAAAPAPAYAVRSNRCETWHDWNGRYTSVCGP